MLGPRQGAQGALFYEVSIEDHVPLDHLLRSVDRFVDLGGLRLHLAPFSKNRHRRFRGSNLVRHLFEEVLARCIAEGLVSGGCGQPGNTGVSRHAR